MIGTHQLHFPYFTANQLQSQLTGQPTKSTRPYPINTSLPKGRPCSTFNGINKHKNAVKATAHRTTPAITPERTSPVLFAHQMLTPVSNKNQINSELAGKPKRSP